MQIDLNTKTITELKAMAYDVITQIEHLQNNVRIINQTIIEKQKEEASVELKKETYNDAINYPSLVFLQIPIHFHLWQYLFCLVSFK